MFSDSVVKQEEPCLGLYLGSVRASGRSSLCEKEVISINW